jgi:hypothetical protein
VQEPEPRYPRSRRQDSSSPATSDPYRGAASASADPSGATAVPAPAGRHAAPDPLPEPEPESELRMVVPTGRPGRVGPRLTGPRAGHRDGGAPRRVPQLPPLGGRGWLVAGCSLVLLVASIALLNVPRHGRSTLEARLSNPITDAPSSPDFSRPPDYGTLPPNPGVPGDGSVPPTAAAPAPPTPAAPGVPGTKPAPATYTAVSGEGCGQTADHGYFRKGFADDWRIRDQGGLTSNGCHGAAVAVPMSGEAHHDDNDNVVVWWFATAPVTGGGCSISVFVPDTGTSSDSAGKPAHYLVFGSADATGRTIGQFDVDQTRHRGAWVDAGQVDTGGQVSVRMVTRGVDFGSGRDGAHLGASAVRVSCTAA